MFVATSCYCQHHDDLCMSGIVEDHEVETCRLTNLATCVGCYTLRCRKRLAQGWHGVGWVEWQGDGVCNMWATIATS